MSQVEKVIQTAKAEVGYHEGRSNGNWNNNNKYSKQVPTLGWSDFQPWCATFVSWVAMKAGVAHLFPRTASTDAAARWFKGKKRWSTYPAIGAMVLYGHRGDMNHTGIVYDFDDTYIYTVEGNTNANGSREGDGVYLKKRQRRDDYVQGYGYPHYSAGIVSADPAWRDARPNTPQVKEPKHSTPRRMQPSAYFIGAHGPHITWLGKRLKAHGFDRKHDGDGYQPGPTFTNFDRENVRDFQLAQGWAGADADGLPGPETLERLSTAPKKSAPKPPAQPKNTGTIADKMNPKAYFIGARGEHVKWLANRLVAHGYRQFYKNGVDALYTKGEDQAAVRKFQEDQGWSGADADGLPGPESLKRLAATPAGSGAASGGAGIIDGVDISRWQSQRLDFKKAKAVGVKFVIHKCTEALHYVDNTYAGRRKPVNDAGLVWGAYHFARPSKSDGAAQARYFLLKAKFKVGDMRPVLDLEDNGGLSTQALVRWTQEFIDAVKQIIGVTPILYSNFDLPGLNRDVPLWVARYNNAMKPPRVPDPFDDWDIWQFSNGTFGKPNSVPGLGHVDINTLGRGVKLADLRIPKKEG